MDELAEMDYKNPLSTRQHAMAMALVYFSPVHLRGHQDTITPEQLANYMEHSFHKLDGEDGESRAKLVKYMEDGICKRDFDDEEPVGLLWAAAIKILKARGEYM